MHTTRIALIVSMRQLKKCVIMYGMICLNSFIKWAESIPTENIILIEPRKCFIDQIRPMLALVPHVILVPKLLTDDNTQKEQTMYLCDTQGVQTYLLNYPTLTDSTIIRKEKCYTTSVCNIIREHKIQVIDQLIINLITDNTKEVLTNACVYDHIISYVHVRTSPLVADNLLDTNCFRKDSYIHTTETYNCFVNRNLNVALPKIAMYLTEPVPQDCQFKFDLLVAQYNITVLNLPYLSKKQTPYDFTANSLETIFTCYDATPLDFDLFMQFNPRYLNNNDVFKLYFPLKPDIIYLNRPYDIIYTTKNCAHMLYQILKSTYFSDHMSNLERNRKAIFKLFRKQYFYDYISKIFVIKKY